MGDPLNVETWSECSTIRDCLDHGVDGVEIVGWSKETALGPKMPFFGPYLYYLSMEAITCHAFITF